MRKAKLLFAVLCFMAIGYGQSYDQCQQRCTNTYNLCTNNADQQLSQCLANAQAAGQYCSSCASGTGQNCPNCSAPNGCPDVYPTCSTMECCRTYESGREAQCNSDYNSAIAACDQNYSACSSDCGDQIPPGILSKKRVTHSLSPVNDPVWASLMRNLSRPGKLGPAL